MKKLMMMLLLMFAAILMACPAFAAEFRADQTTAIGQVLFVPSSRVHVSLISTATAYCIGGTHEGVYNQQQGRAFGSAVDQASTPPVETGIVFTQMNGNATFVGCTAAGTTPSSANEWKSH